MKDILIVTNYFPPETGAASNRLFNLAEGLQKQHFKVTVVTPLPNYPKGKIFNEYRKTFKRTSLENNIKTHRLWIFASNSKNKLLRLIAMLSYSFSLVWFFIFNKIPNTVIVQSPPLLVAFTTMLFLRSKKRKTILNVSDLWPIAGLELGAFKKNFTYKLLEKIERFNYKNADLLLGQSQEILTHINSLFPEKETFLYRSYTNFKLPEIKPEFEPSEKIKIVYAGLLGVAQGIYKLCKKLDYTNIELHIYGAGTEQKKIEYFISKHPQFSIIYHGEIKRNQIHSELVKYDLSIIPLLNRVYGSVPSKIYESSKLGLPILYFGGGEGETIIKDNKLGWVVEAGNYKHLNAVISQLKKQNLTLELKQQIRKIAINTFDFSTQLNGLVKKL